MRLDHLLSTEIMEILPRVLRGGRACGPAVRLAGVGVLAWNGLEAVAWMRCWVPGPPPLWVVFLTPVGFLHGACALCRVLAARWWLENWIVDASGWPAFRAGCLLYCFVRAYFFEWVRVDRFVIV